jgi:hypothetical protein
MAYSPLQSFAGIGVADRKREEGDGEAQHEKVQHGKDPYHPIENFAVCGEAGCVGSSAIQAVGFRGASWRNDIGIL